MTDAKARDAEQNRLAIDQRLGEDSALANFSDEAFHLDAQSERLCAGHLKDIWRQCR